MYKTIIWDWNGTLADDAEASLLSVNDMLERRGMPKITMAQYYSYLDTPISRFYEHLFDLRELPMSEITVEFQAGYARYFTSLQPGAEELVWSFHRAGVRQIILTSGNQEIIERDLRRFQIRDAFDEVLGADDLLAEGKIARGLRWVSGQSGPRDELVLVGDSLHDFETAKAMGVPCILAAIGHQSYEDLRRTGVPTARTFPELAEILRSGAKIDCNRSGEAV